MSSAYPQPVGPRLKPLLASVFLLFALLCVNSAYLSTVTFLEWLSGATYQDQFYLWNFLAHLVLGLLLVVPTILFGIFHWRNVLDRPNPRAKTAGIATLVLAIALLATGVALTRVELFGRIVGMQDPDARTGVYWAHVALPFLAAWVFVIHRLSGRRIKWKIGARWSIAAVGAAALAWSVHVFMPTPGAMQPQAGDKYFEPSLARTADGGFIDPKHLLMNDYCIECHADVHASWLASAHAASSFNNPFYTASVRETRREAFAREGSVQDARFCAGCHDPVPFFSGSFEAAKWDDPNYDLSADPLGTASLTCTSCHSIVSINSNRGNADYTIEASPQYPFAFSQSPLLQWVNRQLVKSKPSFHKHTYLKPEVHRQSEFCGACHKVFLPEALNDYRFIRGQDHLDSFLLSGASGFGAQSWHAPQKAFNQCNDCHMTAEPSNDFAARDRDGSGTRTILSHLFPSANTALAMVRVDDGAAFDLDSVLHAHAKFNDKTIRLDLFGIREGTAPDATQHAPLAETATLPILDAGKTYVLEVIVRTNRIAHEFTQGTADSNEVWLDAVATAPLREIGRIGGMTKEGAVDPWSRFYNAFVIDREGHRIDRRNPQDIFTAVYNNQIPPGAGDLTRVQFTVPDDVTEPITLSVRVLYRKFDATYLAFVFEGKAIPELPILVLAESAITFGIRTSAGDIVDAVERVFDATKAPSAADRWYDYGIALAREGDRGAGRGNMREAERAFDRVAKLGDARGILGAARVQFKEGRLAETAASLALASTAAEELDSGVSAWTIAWFSALAEKQQGNLAEAIALFDRVRRTDFAGARERGFDFSKDVRVLNELAQSLLDLASLTQDKTHAHEHRAVELLEQSCAIDPDQPIAHWLLARAHEALGAVDEAARERQLHERCKVDDNAKDEAVRLARERYPWANHAAEASVLYPLRSDARYIAPHAPRVLLCQPIPIAQGVSK
ncbi:MAG: hypothetical protein EXS10_04655 [Phycisphaerales bacterium]|nr:hypothetical protein [Phycisphaerales bacterium]